MSIESNLLLSAVLLLGSVLASKVSSRLGIPALLVFLGVGMLLGSDGPGGLWFDDAILAQNTAVVALAIILFSGGLDTRWERVRPVAGEAALLATLGVVITAGVVACFVHFILGASWLQGWLMGSIIGSTDAAAVFGVLKSKGLSLKGGSDRVLELESGLNDPMAVFLTLAFTQLLANPAQSAWSLAPMLLQQMALGALFGVALGWLGSRLINRVRLEYDGLYGPMLLAWAMMSYAAAALAGGSGFLAVYLVGVVLGNRPLVHRRSMSEFFDGLAWLMQIAMFLALGLLVFPTRLIPAVLPGLGVAAVLMLVARPAAVFAALAFSGRSLAQKTFISWVGLRGAVPIILATYPMVAGVQGANSLFHVVFFVVITSVLLQGTTLDGAARWLKLAQPAQPDEIPPLRFVPTLPSGSQMLELTVLRGSVAEGSQLLELDLPPESLVVLITRRDRSAVPRGATRLCAGDVATLLAPGDRVEDIRSLFEAPPE